MKFMLFAATALAATQVKRQLSVVESAIASISSGTVALDNGIKSFSGISDAGSLEDVASGLVSTLNSANSAVSGISVLSNTDAASLATPIQNLGTLVQQTVSDLKSKKSTFVSAGVGGVVYSSAQDLQSAAKTFTATVLSKVPSNLQSLGNTLAAPINSALADAVSSFADQADAGSPSGSSSASSAPSSTYAPPSSSASASSSAAASTTSAAASSSTAASATTSAAATATTSKPVTSYTGAAVANSINKFGVAVAVFAGAALL